MLILLVSLEGIRGGGRPECGEQNEVYAMAAELTGAVHPSVKCAGAFSWL